MYGVRGPVYSTPLYASELCLEHKMHGNSTSRAHGRPGVRNTKVSLEFITGNRPGLHQKYLWKVIATCFSNINHVAKITCWGTTTLLSPNYPGKFAFSGNESLEITMYLHSLSLIILTHIYIESSSSPKSCKQNQQNKMTVLMELELWTNM